MPLIWKKKAFPAVKVNNDRHQLLFTLGVHF